MCCADADSVAARRLVRTSGGTSTLWRIPGSPEYSSISDSACGCHQSAHGGRGAIDCEIATAARTRASLRMGGSTGIAWFEFHAERHGTTHSTLFVAPNPVQARGMHQCQESPTKVQCSPEVPESQGQKQGPGHSICKVRCMNGRMHQQAAAHPRQSCQCPCWTKLLADSSSVLDVIHCGGGLSFSSYNCCYGSRAALCYAMQN